MPLTLPIDIHGRRWSFQYERGNVFKDSVPFEVVTLKIAIKSLIEAEAVAERILRAASYDRQENF